MIMLPVQADTEAELRYSTILRCQSMDLRDYYNKLYSKGEKHTFTSLVLGEADEESLAVIETREWKGVRVLEVGCGTGDLCRALAELGAEVTGIDFSQEAIRLAIEKGRGDFRCQPLDQHEGRYDVVISFGVLEHLDDPFKALRKMSTLADELILACPSWLNTRGYVLHALLRLYGARITLADLHYLTPVDFEEFAKELGMDLEWKTVDQSWGHGEKMLKDFARRLPKLVDDPTRVNDLIGWLRRNLIEEDTKLGGAVGVYHLRLKGR
jgi:2-polyprenyl-3-methyl-5-hydroxy-6-metoxy-1,4-benzoquinol methylase